MSVIRFLPIFSAQIYMSPHNVALRVDRGRTKQLAKAAALLRKIASNKIRRRKSKVPSKPGSPPFTHTGALRKSIRYAISPDRRSAIVGPVASSIGRVGQTHEFGGTETITKKQKRAARAKNNWNLTVGGHGPIDVTGRGQNRGVRFAKLHTAKQAYRSNKLRKKALSALGVHRLDIKAIDEALAKEGRLAPKKRVRYYPHRPFMAPALSVAMRYKEFTAFEF